MCLKILLNVLCFLQRHIETAVLGDENVIVHYLRSLGCSNVTTTVVLLNRFTAFLGISARVKSTISGKLC